MKLPASAVSQLGLTQPKVRSVPAPEPAPAPAPAPSNPAPAPVILPMDSGVAAAVERLREQIAGLPEKKRPVGMDMTVERDVRGQITKARVTFDWG